MKTIERNADIISGDEDLERLHTFSRFPVFMGCTVAPQAEDTLFDMSFWISRGSGMIQLNPLLPLDVLYPEAHGAGCVGALWAKHHQALADFIAKFKPSSVLEIGGAHGILATNYQKTKRIPWTILEPNPTPVAECEATIIKGFFDENFHFQGEVDAVVHSHVFEHIYQPEQFMRHLSAFMAIGSKLIFSLPNMETMLERKYTNCINLEHTAFLTEPYIEYLLAKHGFRLLSKEYFMDDHSIFYASVRDPSVKPVDLPGNLYHKNKKLYLDYVEYHEELIKEINSKIKNARQAVYLFGAHVFAQYLIAFGLDTSRVVKLLDNDLNKQGKRLYGTNLMVDSPKALAQLANPIVILKAGVYNQEIKADILNNINDKVVFLE